MKHIILLLCMLLEAYSLTLAQNATEWQQAYIDAMNAGDQSTAFQWLIVGAETGDSVAQCGIAIAYLHGDGTEKDLQKAEYWATKSAKSGYAYAQALLGDLNYNVYHNTKDAIYWWEKAASQNDKHSGHCMYQLAKIYFNGDGVPKDEKEAFKWVEKAAENGDVDAMIAMADAFFYGDRGLEIDYPKALKWCEMAIAANKLPAEYLYNAALLYKFGLGTDINLKRSYELLSRAAELKYAQAYNDLAYFYAEGRYVPQNFDLALEMVDEAISLEPMSPKTCNFYNSKGEILLMQNKKDEALLIWDKIKTDFPDRIEEMSDTPFVQSIKIIANEK